MTFVEMLRARWQKANSMVCVGLDSDYSLIPKVAEQGLSVFDTIRGFNVSVIAATRDLVCAFKPNMAFYEGEGFEGLRALEETIKWLRTVAPDIPVILDAKRTDIGNTNKGYARMAFDWLGADAITVNPYFGGEALGPFLERKDKGVVVLCRTSNPGAADFQNVLDEGNCEPLYERVAKRALEWNKNGNVMLVVGATAPTELARVRQIVDDMPILVPGIGAQQGDLDATVNAGLDSTGFGMVINSSRGIIFPKDVGNNRYEAVEREAKKLRDQINEIKSRVLTVR